MARPVGEGSEKTLSVAGDVVSEWRLFAEFILEIEGRSVTRHSGQAGDSARGGSASG
jgi:hypothetical protein